MLPEVVVKAVATRGKNKIGVGSPAAGGVGGSPQTPAGSSVQARITAQ